MTQSLLNGCLNFGLNVAFHTIKTALAPGYHPNKHYLNNHTIGDELFITKDVLLAKTPSEALQQMRQEGLKALNSFGRKFTDTLTSKITEFGDKVEQSVKEATHDIETTVDKTNVLIDTILFRMAEKSQGELKYTEDFGKLFKAEVARCGLDNMSEIPVNPTPEQEKKYGQAVDKRLKKYDITKDNTENYVQMRDQLILHAAQNTCEGAADSVKFALIESFFDGAQSFVKGLLGLIGEVAETGLEMALSLLTGQAVNLDFSTDSAKEEPAPLETVTTKGRWWNKFKNKSQVKETEQADANPEEITNAWLDSLLEPTETTKTDHDTTIGNAQVEPDSMA